MASLTKICNHWTAGNYTPCEQDLNAYHYLVDDKGRIYTGMYKPQDNINCNDGIYARHCGGGNTGCIGVSACGMVGFTEKEKQTKCPLTKKQIETMCCLNAYLSIKYGILVNEKNIFTHYEFDRQKKKPEGKIDIIYLPYLPSLSKYVVGTYLRQKIAWYKEKTQEGKYELKKKGKHYEFIASN